jgi:cell division protein FtsB
VGEAVSSKARIAVASVVFVGFLFGAVFPTRTYLAQRREIAAATQRLALFRQENGHLDTEAKRLQSDEEIERIARARFNLVRPGEEAYAIVPVPKPDAPPAPPAASPVTQPPAPSPVLAWVRGTLERLF